MPAPTPPPASHGLRPRGVLALAAVALAATLLLDAPAMLRSAGTMEPGTSRDIAEASLRPVAGLSAALRADRLRAAAESLERRFLEPPPPVLPAAPDIPVDDDDDDDDLDKFLDFAAGASGADEEECCQCDSVASCQFQFPMKGAEEEMATGNIGIGNTSTLATFNMKQCCQCDSVASCQFQFSMKEAS